RHFGHVAGISVGTRFPTRSALAAAGVHPPLRAGISGSAQEGADSIVLNGGYEDDEDLGDEVIYTGHGGNDPGTGRQIADQELKAGNRALAKNRNDGLPVRVIRGWREPSGRGPATGFRYDGLYRVESYWSERGRRGFTIWRFRLVQMSDASFRRSTRAIRESTPPIDGIDSPERAPATTQRIVRNTTQTQRVKEIHKHRCQVCGTIVQTLGGPYA